MFWGIFEKAHKESREEVVSKMITSDSNKEATINGHEHPISNHVYDAEKQDNELGSPKNYILGHRSLQARGWQIYLESDIAKILVRTLVDGVIGSGLKCQSQPIEEILGIPSEELKSIKKQIELRFRLYCDDDNSTFSKMQNFHELTRDEYEAMIVGGDCLSISRYDNGVNKEVIDGRFISTPLDGAQEKADKRGNIIIHGVEINKKTREHKAYHILQSDNTHKRVARKSASGRIQATMLYGDKYRIEGVRGMPVFVRSIEKMKKIDRYIEAMVGSAEERAKFSVFFENNHFSTGENPLMQSILQNELSEGIESIPFATENDMIVANKKYAQTSGKQAVNLPIGVSAKTVDSTVELRLREFCDGTFLYICASLGIPIEIALSKFEQSFSASRMASEIWKMQVKLKRRPIEKNNYQPFYNYFLDTEIALGNIVFPGYEEAVKSKDIIRLQAYRNARFTGHGVPNADPVKEVKAVVLMLQNNLISHEEAAELLADTEFEAVIDKLSDEYKTIISKIPIDYQRPPNAETDSAELPQEPK